MENGTVFAGFPQTDLKTAIKTAGDLNQMQVQVKLLGTQFGVAPPNVPMPANISLANDGFRCPKPSMQGQLLNFALWICFCVLNFNYIFELDYGLWTCFALLFWPVFVRTVILLGKRFCCFGQIMRKLCEYSPARMRFVTSASVLCN